MKIKGIMYIYSMKNGRILKIKRITLIVLLFPFFLGFLKVKAQKINQFTKNNKRKALWKKYNSNKHIRYTGSSVNGKEVAISKYYDITTSKHPTIIKEFLPTSDSAKVSYYNLDGKLRTKGAMVGKK